MGAKTASKPAKAPLPPKKGAGRPRVGSAFIHGVSVPAGHDKNGKPLFKPARDGVSHWDVQYTKPDGTRSRRICMPVKMSEAMAREKAAAWTIGAALPPGSKGYIADDREPGKGKPAEEGETLSTWADRWIAARQARGLENAHVDGQSFAKWILRGAGLGERPIAGITRDDIEGAVEYLDRAVRAGELAWKTAANAWGLLSKAFSDAQNAKERTLRVRDDNPAAGVRGPDRGQRKSKAWLHPSDVLAILENAVEPLEVRRVLALQVYLYLRPGELRALQWEDVDLAAGRVRVHRAERRDGTTKTTKTKTARVVPIEPTLAPLLAAMHEQTGGQGTVAPGMPKDTMLADVLHDMLGRAKIKRPDLFASDDTRKRITWYDLRATGITWRAIRGDDPIKIMYQAGHSDFKTTQGYIREADAVGDNFGDVFPPLPSALARASFAPEYRSSEAKSPEALWVDRDSNRGADVEKASKQGVSRQRADVETTSSDELTTRTDVLRSDMGAKLDVPIAPSVDPVEVALADAVQRAAAAGEWSVVAQLGRELEARRTGRVGSNVVPIDRARRGS